MKKIAEVGKKVLGAMGPLGSIASGVLSAGGMLLQNRANRNSAREQMAFQERMSNTSVQRSASDFAKAGFNPINAVNNAASSPGGAMANIGDSIGAGIASARSSRMLQTQLAQSAQSVELLKEQTAEAKARARIANNESVISDVNSKAMSAALLGQNMSPSPAFSLASARVASELAQARGQTLNNERLAQVMRHSEAQLPYMLRQSALDNLISMYNSVGAGVESRYQGKYGEQSRLTRDALNTTNSARGITDILSTLFNQGVETRSVETSSRNKGVSTRTSTRIEAPRPRFRMR